MTSLLRSGATFAFALAAGNRGSDGSGRVYSWRGVVTDPDELDDGCRRDHEG